ncbi:MAG: Sphingobium phage Lacusarx [Pseudomonadota bacterium]|jgi:hypothetical protein
MAQLAVAFAGAALGAATLGTAPVLFGMTGSAIGFAAGSIIGGAIAPPRMHGPRVEDLKVQISSYGAPLSKTYGTDRVAGVLIWAADFVETAHKQGGKGGPKVTTYSYTCSFAVAIGEGEVGAVRRIWADSKLVYDARVGGEDPIAVQNAKFRQYWTLYPGSETQEPDATIEAVEGAGNVEAYRGTCYMVFTNLPLGDYGNRIPSFSFELTQETEDTTPTADILEPLKVYPWVYNAQSMPEHGIGDTYYEPITVGSVSAGTGFGTMAVAQADAYEASSTLTRPGAAKGAYNFTGYFWSHFSNASPYATLNKLYMNGGSNDDPEFVSVLHSYYSLKLVDVPYGAAPVKDVVALNEFAATTPFYDRRLSWPHYGVAGYTYDAPVIVRREIGNSGPQPGEYTVVNSAVYDTYPAGDISYVSHALELKGSRVPTHPLKTCYAADSERNQQIAQILGMAEAPSDNEWCVTFDGQVVPNRNWTIVTGTAKQLAGVEYRSGALYQNALGPVLLPGDPNYNNTAYWDAARDAAIAAGTLQDGATTPVVVTSWAESDGGPDVTSVQDGTVLLSTIVTDICEAAGLSASDIDVTELTDEVIGYSRASRMAARQAIEPLRLCYQFDGVESDGKIAWRKRVRSSVATLTVNDLGAQVDEAAEHAMHHERGQEQELPRAVTVLYRSYALDYAVGAQEARRQGGETDQLATVEVPVVLTDDHARQLADVILYGGWVARNVRSFTTTLAWAHLEPTDVVTVSDDDL